MKRFALCVLAVSLPSVGCDSVASLLPAVSDSSDASSGFRAFLDAVGSGEAELSLLRRTPDAALSFRGAGLGDAGDVDIDVICEGGGAATIRGELASAGDGLDLGDPDASALTIAFDLTVSFDACEVDGVTIDGSVAYALSAEIDGTQELYTWQYDGRVEFTGAIEGSCEIDAQASSDDYGDVGDERDFEGTVCGFEAEELDLDKG